MSKFAPAAVATVYVLLSAGAARAQRGTGDWTTGGNDAQRSSWVRADGKISPESMRKPGFELLWKIKLNNAARQLNSLTAPVLLDFYIGFRGFRSLGFVGGSSNTVVGIDVDLGRIEWEKNLGSVSAATGGSILCPGGITSGVTRPTLLAYPGNALGRGFGRGTPARSGVGEPFEGAATIRNRTVPPATPVTVAAAPARRVVPPPNPFAPTVQYVHAVSGDGKLHSLYVSTGEEPNPPISFLPPGANAQGLIVFDKTAYVATVNNCGGVDNGVWALNPDTKQVAQWKSGGNVAGSFGPAVGPDGTLYVAGADGELVALEEGTLMPKGAYKSGQKFSSSPVVFEYKGKDLIAVSTSDGGLHLLDAAAFAGDKPLFRTPVSSGTEFAAGALASWQDPDGTRWILAPTTGAIAAWKVVDSNGTPALQAAWTSRAMMSPLPPIVVNGVVFAVAGGELSNRNTQLTAAQIAQRSSKAVLYALDAGTGKELWNSGAAIGSFVHSGGLAAGGSRVYVSGYDGTQYAFGFPIEH